MPKRVYIPVTTREYAQSLGISERTARRRLKDVEGATQSKRSKKWSVPLSAKQYAELKGISERSARRKGISTFSLADWALTVRASERPTRKELRAATHHARLAAKHAKRKVKLDTSTKRMRHASSSQLDRILGLTDSDYQGPNWFDNLMSQGGWGGDDDLPILYVY